MFRPARDTLEPFIQLEVLTLESLAQREVLTLESLARPEVLTLESLVQPEVLTLESLAQPEVLTLGVYSVSVIERFKKAGSVEANSFEPGDKRPRVNTALLCPRRFKSIMHVFESPL